MSWKEQRLEEIANCELGKMLDKNKNKGEYEPYLSNVDVRWGYFELDNLKKMRFESREFERYSLKAGDIIMCEGGEAGRCAVWQETTPKMMYQKALHRIRPLDGVESKFLYYTFLNMGNQNEIEPYYTGTTIKHLPLQILKKIPIKIAPHETQKRIASILSTYDDLIENNLKRITLLEETAQNIYKEWFVNFRFPNYEHTEFDSESGLPFGWEVCPLNEFIDFKEGPGLRNWQFKDEGVPFLNIRMMGDGELDFSSVKYLDISEIETKYSHFLLSEYDHIVSTSGTLGKVVTIRQTHLPLCLNTSIIRMRPLREEIGKWQLREILKSPDFINEMKSYATGSAQLNFGPKHLNLMMLKVPSLKIGLQFEMIISPIEIQICSLLDINQKLKEARDILLPRLMNRTIEV
jgi:type I restriction enzyme S subunit